MLFVLLCYKSVTVINAFIIIITKKHSEGTQTLHAGCSKADPQTNKHTNKHTDRCDYNTLCNLARNVIIIVANLVTLL